MGRLAKLRLDLRRTGSRFSSRVSSRVLGPAIPIGPPVFIVGCGHSGTTLLLAMLSMHSRLYSVPYESYVANRTDADIDWFVRRFNREAKAAGKARWVEKTPRHILFIERLFDRFPDARVLVMLRDGRDVACSIHARSGDFDSGTSRWRADTAAAEPFLDHPATHLVRYEDLIENDERCIREVIDFIGEPFEPELLEHHTGSFRFLGSFEKAEQASLGPGDLTEPPKSVSGAHHRLYRSWQVSQPLFDGRGRWRDDLTDEQKARFKALAGEQLIACGYAIDHEW